jgi:hypothetical protein
MLLAILDKSLTAISGIFFADRKAQVYGHAFAATRLPDGNEGKQHGRDASLRIARAAAVNGIARAPCHGISRCVTWNRIDMRVQEDAGVRWISAMHENIVTIPRNLLSSYAEPVLTQICFNESK